MRILKVDPLAPDAAVIALAVEALRHGEVVAYLTDTMYGLAIDPRNESAIARLFALKQRAPQKAIPLIAGAHEQLAHWIEAFPSPAQKLAERFWPGPLTMIFRARANVSPKLTAGSGTIAVRVPNSTLARELSLQLGAPITATSANLSGDTAVLAVDEIATQLGHDIDVVLDSGRAHSLVPSTIIDVSVAPFRLVREGVISIEALQKIIGAIAT